MASLAVAAALQAVDGVALKTMVDAWAAAPASEKPALFQAAFAVRQIEIGLASMVSLLFGATGMLYGAAILRDGRLPRWTAILAIGGGAGTFAGGLALAHAGFSPAAQTINLASSSILLLWMIAVGIYGWPRDVF